VPTANERKALWFLAVVAISGSGVRVWRATAKSLPAADGAALARQIGRVDSARAAGQPRRSDRPKPSAAPTPPGRLVDLDTASAHEIEGLPGIGPALASRIVANRDSLGAFGHIDAVCDVRGVGAALATKLRPLVTFSAPRRPVSGACGEASKKPRKARAARTRQLP